AWDAAQPAGACPHARGERGVVVAGDHQPAPFETGERIEETPHGLVRYRLRIEDIAGHQDRVHALLAGQRRDSRDRVQPRRGELRGVSRREAWVGAADRPVGGVQEAGHLKGWMNEQRFETRGYPGAPSGT